MMSGACPGLMREQDILYYYTHVLLLALLLLIYQYILKIVVFQDVTQCCLMQNHFEKMCNPHLQEQCILSPIFRFLKFTPMNSLVNETKMYYSKYAATTKENQPLKAITLEKPIGSLL
jgi:hypothetical protein